MRKIELNFQDYSPVKDGFEKLSAADHKGDITALQEFFGIKSADATELAASFCHKIQEEIKKCQPQPVEIGHFLFQKEKTADPIVLFEYYDGKWWTQGYVGAIRLTLKKEETEEKEAETKKQDRDISGDLDVTIRIRSRFDNKDKPEKNPFLKYVLEKAFDLKSEETKGFVYENMTVENTLSAVFDLLLLHLFFRQLRRALKKGMYRQYQEFAHNDSNVKGRFDVPRHIKENGPLNNGRICYVTREYTVNNSVNQLILKAAECLEQKYRSAYRDLLRKPEHEQCAKGLATLKGELFDTVPVSTQQALRNAGKKITHSIYRDYEPLRNTCTHILRRLGTDYGGEEDGAAGLLLDMPTLWEIFLYNTVFREFIGSQDGYKQKIRKILGGKRSVKPDFLWEKKLVLDAKFKNAWAEAYARENWEENEGWYGAKEIRKDLFQVIAYMHIFQCNTGGVIFPVLSEKATEKAGSDGVDLELEFEFEIKTDATPKSDSKIESKLPDERLLLLPYFIPKATENFDKTMEENSKRICRFLSEKI